MNYKLLLVSAAMILTMAVVGCGDGDGPGGGGGGGGTPAPTATGHDFNGDGYDDVIVGAHGDDNNGTNSGSAFIFFGGSSFGGSHTASGVADVTIQGDSADYFLGYSVSSAGDVNGDGYDDVIVGAPGDSGASTSTGSAFIFFGGAAFSGVKNASTADVVINGDTLGDSFGVSVSGAGDVNNDGFDDVIIGAYLDDDNGNSSGSAFIFLGSASISASMTATTNADVKIIGDDIDDNFGFAVSGAGDINNDGFDDTIVGAYADDDNGSRSGSIFIYFGEATFSSGVKTATAFADVEINGDSALEDFGYSVSNAGDINNDGFDDIVVGAYSDDDNGAGSGSAFIFFGKATYTFGAKTASTFADVVIYGDAAGDNLGLSVSDAGDVNNDGFDDIVVGAYLADGNGTDSGSVYVFFGKATFAAGSKVASNFADIKINGDAASDVIGIAVSDVGDVNSDGFDDLMVGATGDDDNGSASGSSFIFFGKSTYTAGAKTATSFGDVKIRGDSSDDQFGYSVGG